MKNILQYFILLVIIQALCVSNFSFFEFLLMIDYILQSYFISSIIIIPFILKSSIFGQYIFLCAFLIYKTIDILQKKIFDLSNPSIKKNLFVLNALIFMITTNNLNPWILCILYVIFPYVTIYLKTTLNKSQ